MAAVLTGADVKALTSSIVVGVKAPLECWPIATDRVSYVGEPVAVVVAPRPLPRRGRGRSDRGRVPAAAGDRRSRPRDRRRRAACCTPRSAATSQATAPSATAIPRRAFAEAPHRIEVEVQYPRSACTPIETYGVLAEYEPGNDSYDVLANFQGPFSIHAVISRALKVPGNRLRLRTPQDSGGSFGVKQGVFPYIVLIAAAARVAGRPVKWIEDRLEHLAGAVCGDKPRHASRGRSGRGRPHHWRSTGTRSRIAAPISARRNRRRCIACTAT